MVTEFCGTPAPQVVSQPALPPTGSLGFPIHKETLESDRVWEAFWDWSAPSAGDLGALRRGLFLARAPGVVERGGNRGSQIGSTLVEREGGGTASSSRPVNHSLLWRRGAGPLSPAWQGVATWPVPPGSLDWRWGGGRRRASLPPPLAHSGPNQSLATCWVGTSGSWRTAGCRGGGVEGRKARGWGGPAGPSQPCLLVNPVWGGAQGTH